ncbi:MAG: alpha/beta hydrolase [Bacteroidota bacterium]
MKKLIAKALPLIYGKYFNLIALVCPKKAAEKAFTLFCTIRKGRVLPRQKDFLDNAKADVLPSAGHQIQTYQWPGKKETVLLVHGWESNAFRWRNLIEKLRAADFNVVAFDAPGHGNSSGQMLYVPLYSDCLQDVIQKYDPKYLVGHSVGGMTILYNDHKNQNAKIEKMVTIGSPSEFYEIMDHFQDVLKFNHHVMKALDAYVFERFAMHINDFSSSVFVGSNTKKGLLFHDRLDQLAPYHASEKVHKDWKGSRLVSTEGLGHSMHQEEVNDQIIEFLET